MQLNCLEKLWNSDKIYLMKELNLLKHTRLKLIIDGINHVKKPDDAMVVRKKNVAFCSY